MRIDNVKLDLWLARQQKSLIDLRSSGISPQTLTKVRRGEAVKPKSLFNISTCADWREDFLPCKAKIRRHPDGWQGFLTLSGRKIRRQDGRGEMLNRL